MRTNKFLIILTLFLGLSHIAIGQTFLGSTTTFKNKLKNELVVKKDAKIADQTLLLEVSKTQKFTAKINYKKSELNAEFLIGEISSIPLSSFYIKVNDNSLEGHIILRKTKEAYKYYSDKNGKAYVSKVDINSVVCIDYKNVPQKKVIKTTTQTAKISSALLNLQSLPGAAGCVLLDFDGYNMPAGNLWNNGNAINAAASGMTDAQIQQHWEVVSEDYRPFNLNITTSETVFNTYAKNRRVRIVVTPTNTAAPGAGGVAYIGTFNWDNDVPAWVFILDGKNGGEASSHEIGHTFDLEHDGRTNPSEAYFVGLANTSWAPIMGAGYNCPVTQWSKGEYNYANNLQDDVATIAGSKFGVGYRTDDYADNTAGATNLDYNTSGTITQKNGIISSEADYDFFSFSTGGGNVVINANTVARDGDLHLLLRLYNSSSTLIGTYWNSDPYKLNASMSVNLAAGKYYIGVDGTGAGDKASGGYSAYASIGSYSITGTIPPTIATATTGLVTVYKDINYTGFSGGLEIGDYNLAKLNSLGVLNDDISSIKIMQGYKAILYQDDNFGGSSTTITADTSSLNSTWNDKVSSIKILANGTTTLGGLSYYLQNRNSNLYMDVWSASTADGGNIAQGAYNGNDNQKFTFTHLGDGLYKIVAAHSGKSIDVSGVSKADGANVQQWTYGTGENQQFIMVSTGDGFYKMIAKHSGKLVEVIGANTTSGANIQQWTNNNQTCAHWKLFPAVTPILIQAESYSSMSGIQTETTTDTGGGLNVSYTDTADWLAYNSINIPVSGSYLIEYRVASNLTGSKLSSDLNAGSIVLGSLTVPNTGGWQTWTTISHTVNINAGTYNFGLYVQNTGFNINWIRISKVAVAIAKQANQSKEVASTNNDLIEKNVTISPNPVAEKLIISSNTDLKGAQIMIYDIAGRKALFETVYKNNCIDTASLQAGLYILSVVFPDGNISNQKFIKN